MVKLLIGHKGSGKTKRMIELANETVQTARGSIVFINKNSRLIYDLDYKIRVVCMEDFPHITNEDEYIGFLFGFVVPFGLAFELPVALYITTRMGLTDHQMLASKRKFVILAVAIVAAILTPPDVVSQIMLAIPILLLYEIALLICRFVKPKSQDASSEA